jgi:HNH endonuclease
VAAAGAPGCVIFVFCGSCRTSRIRLVPIRPTNRLLVALLLYDRGMTNLLSDRFNFDERRYSPIGKCVYCGATGAEVKLFREHIIPYSLGGRTVLPEASCGKCADVTHVFERTCARLIFGAFRIHQKMPTRRAAERPTTLPLRITIEGREETRMVPVDDYPGAPLMAMKLGPPGIIIGLEPSDVFPQITPVMFAPSFPDTAERLKHVRAKAGPGQGIAIEGQFDMRAFSRLLAKIAHCYAVAEYGLETFRPLLCDFILGRNKNQAHYIGGSDITLLDQIVDGKRATHLQQLGIYSVGNRHFLCAMLQLFSTIGFPVYWIVVGDPTPELAQRLLSRTAP